MKIICGSCKSSFNIPDKKLPMGKKVSFPCPKCKEKIKLDLRVREAESEKNAKPQNQMLDGEALREEILRTLKSLPDIPQVVLKAREIMSNAISTMEGMGSNIEAYMFMLDDKAMDFIGISETDVKPIIDQINQKVSEMAGGV